MVFICIARTSVRVLSSAVKWSCTRFGSLHGFAHTVSLDISLSTRTRSGKFRDCRTVEYSREDVRAVRGNIEWSILTGGLRLSGCMKAGNSGVASNHIGLEIRKHFG